MLFIIFVLNKILSRKQQKHISAVKLLRLYILAIALCLAGAGTIAHAAVGDDVAQEVVQQPAVRVIQGAVEVSNTADDTLDVTVFAITGTVVKQLQIPAGETVTLELPAGYYIVKAGKLSRRVAVK